MCGITGAVFLDSELAIPPDVLQRMTDTLSHRGPDDHGSYRSDLRIRPPYEPTPGVALGHRRLSIIDIAGGQQPMSNEDESVWVVFNGEIYNFRELHRRLDGRGHTFRTASDTETLVHLYEDEGRDFVRHLVGMFSLAVWDARQRQLVIACDRLGQKPLYYHLEPNRLSFASELKSLLEVPGVERALDPAALDEYLTYQYVPYPNTIFRDIRKLPPAHYGVYRDGRLETHAYWSAFTAARATPIAAQDAAPQLRKTLSEAVRLRMQSEVPLGAFLSGGVDSAILCALMQEQGGETVKTFSIGFGDALYDESTEAAATAKHLGTEHETLRVEPSAVDILPRLCWHFDEPFADSSALPTWYLAEMARRNVTVALSGDGGDELFLGYPRYRAAALAAGFDRCPKVLRSIASSNLWQQFPSSANRRSRLHRGKKFLAELKLEPGRRYLNWIAIFNESQRAELYADDFLASLPESDPADFVLNDWRTASDITNNAVATAGLTDLVTYLPGDLMTKVDRVTMAHGLECRQPFLDHRVVELALRIPPAVRYRRGHGKRVFREAFGDLLPAEVFKRPKRGFGVPLARWFREDLHNFAKQILLDEKTIARGIFRRNALARLVETHAAGRAEHGDRLWALLVLELWMREWID